MINSWEHFNLQPNFQNILSTRGKPSDLDMFYLTQDKFLIIGEFKNGDMGKLGEKQKELFETFIDNYKNGGIIIYATHHTTIEQGATNYDAAQCEVEQYYLKGQWHKPKRYTIVQDIFDKYDKEKQMNIECDREKIIYKHTKEDKVFYSIGLYKKQQDGTYLNGYMSCRFPKDAELTDKTRIKIHEGWLDFYIKDNKTYPYIFINKYEIVEKNQDGELLDEVPANVKTDYDDSSIQLNDNDLPF